MCTRTLGFLTFPPLTIFYLQMALRALSATKVLRSAFRTQARLQGIGLSYSRALQTLSLPDLPYDYGALQPAISAEIMQLHHQKHHQAYVTNYNTALEQLHEAIAKGDADAVVKLQTAIKFNGGGTGFLSPSSSSPAFGFMI